MRNVLGFGRARWSSTSARRTVYESPLVGRYVSPEMAYNFSEEKKFITFRKLWLALAQAQHELGLSQVTAAHLKEMRAHLTDINYEVAEAKEKEIRHDVMSHIHAFGTQCPGAAGIIHLGATSCYVGDNTDLIVMRDGLDLIQAQLLRVIVALRQSSLDWKHLPTLGYTHFQPAQLTTVGKRSTLWLQDFVMDFENIEHVKNSLRFRGAKGTTGTQASFLQLFHGDHSKVRALDARVTELMQFHGKPIGVTGQTYTRKQDYFVLAALSGVAQVIRVCVLLHFVLFH
jgi:adenylosuccinate lyase